MMLSTGNKSVDMVGQMHLTGNVIPAIWCKRICYSNGKPNLNAIMILSDIVYWYRPREIRDEATGCIIRFEKKFRADLLQRNYLDFAEQFGLSKKQTKDAFDLLESLGVIFRELRTIEAKGRTMNNVLFIGLNAEKLHEITIGEDNPTTPTKPTPKRAPEASSPSIHKSEESPDIEVGSLPTSKYNPVSLDVGTNTKNTTETTERDYDNHIHHSRKPVESSPTVSSPDHQVIDGMDEINAYRKLIRHNLEYDMMLSDLKYSSDKERFKEIYELICDVVCKKSGTVRIAGEDKPYQIVKSTFLKLNHEHVKYVIDCLEKTTSKIGNMRNYLLTALYHAPQSFQNSICQQVNHDNVVFAASGG